MRRRYHSVVRRQPTASRGVPFHSSTTLVVAIICACLAGAGSSLSAQEAEPGLPLFPMRVRWTTDFGVPPTAGPTADNTRVYMPLSSGTVVAVDADTGAVQWRAEGLETTLSLATDAEGVFVVLGDALVALDHATGTERWRLSLPDTVSAPVVARAGWIVVGLGSGEVIAVRSTDGSVVWRRTYPTPIVSPAVIHGERLYLPGSDARVRAARIEDGTLVWEQVVGGAVLTIAPLGARVYVGADDNFFYALDERQGRRLWRWRTGGDPVGEASADDRRVFFSSLDTLVRALDRGHGAQLWRRPLPWRPRSGPLLVGTTALVSGVALDLRGFTTSTGEPAGEFALSPDRLEVLEGVPAVVVRRRLPGAYVMVALADGRLLALEHAFGLQVQPLTQLPGQPVAITPPPPSAAP